MNVNQCMEPLVVSSKPLAVPWVSIVFQEIEFTSVSEPIACKSEEYESEANKELPGWGYRSSWRPLLGFWMLRVSISLSLNWPTVAFPKTTSFRLLALVSKFLTSEVFSGLCYNVLQAQATTLEWTECTCSCIIQLLGQCLHPYA
jgi:hypothetical protein